MLKYQYILDTYNTERMKTISTWSLFLDEDMHTRPHPSDHRGRNLHEHMVHQCLSEHNWFRDFLEIDVTAQPLPSLEYRSEFVFKYYRDSKQRLLLLQEQEDSWWEEETAFFDITRSRSWILTRRLLHSAHHRGQLVYLLRVLNRNVYSTYGPTADTGGLAIHDAPTIYPYPDDDNWIERILGSSTRNPLPDPSEMPVTERADSLITAKP